MGRSKSASLSLFNAETCSPPYLWETLWLLSLERLHSSLQTPRLFNSSQFLLYQFIITNKDEDDINFGE